MYIIRVYGEFTAENFIKILSSGFLGVGVGMVLILSALKTSEVGIIGVLSGISPILILPMLWIATKKPKRRSAGWRECCSFWDYINYFKLT